MTWLANLLAPGAGAFLLVVNVVLQTSVVIVAAGLVTKTFFRHNPAAAHAAWLACLLFVAACPLVLVAARAAGVSRIALTQHETTPATSPTPHPTDSTTSEIEHGQGNLERNEDALLPETDFVDTRPLIQSKPTASPQPIAPTGSVYNTFRTVSLRQYAVALGVVVWLLGVLLLALRLLHGVIVARELKRSAMPFDLVGREDVLARVRQSSGMAALPPILVSDRIAVPLVVGGFRPAILLPASLPGSVGPARLHDVLLHECAHVLRRDHWIGLLQRLVAIIYWPHPLVHLMNRRLASCREEVCDNYVLAASNPADYADTLLALAVGVQPHRILLGSMGIFGFRWKLEDRVRDLLHVGRDRSVRLGRRARAALFVVVALVLAAAGVFRVGIAAEAEQQKPLAENTTEEPVLSSDSDGELLNVDGQPWRPGFDLDGEPLPQGVTARLGSRRLRHCWGDRIAILPDNQRLLSWGRNGGDVRLWDLKSGKLLRTLDFEGLSLSAAALSRDGQSFVALVVQLDREERKPIYELRLFDTDTWRERIPVVSTTALSDTNEVALSPDGSMFATADIHPNVFLWDAASGRCRKHCWVGERKIASLAFSADGGVLAIATPGGVLLWNWANENEPKPLDDSPRYALALAFSPDGRLLATGHGGEAAAELWDVPSRRHVATLKGPAKNHYREQMTFSPDGKTLIVPGNPAKVVEMFDVHTGQLTQSLDAGTIKPRDVAISPNGKHLAAVGSQTAIKLWEMPEARLKTDRFTGHEDSVQEIVYTPDGRQIVTGGMDGAIRIGEARTGRPLQVLRCDHWIVSLATSPDGTRIASCSLDDTVRLWNAQSGREIFRLPGHGRLGGNMNYGVGFDRTGKRFLSFGLDLNLRVWSTETGKLLAELPIRPSGLELIETEGGPVNPNGADLGGPVGADESLMVALRGVAFSAAGDRLLVHCENTLYLFDTASGEEVDKWTPENSMDQCVISPDGGTIVTIESQGKSAFGTPDFLVTLRLHRGALGKDVVEMETVGNVYIHTSALSPDGQLLATVRANRDASQRYSIHVDRVETGEPIARIEAEPSQFPNRMVFAPDGQSLAVTYRDTSTLVWDLSQAAARSGNTR